MTLEAVEKAIMEAFNRFDMRPGERPIAMAIHWPFGPAYGLLKALCQGMVNAMTDAIKSKMPLVVVFDNDIAKLVGNMLIDEFSLNCNVVSVDGIDLQEFDYIDIGKELAAVQAVPVIIKSLVFNC